MKRPTTEHLLEVGLEYCPFCGSERLDNLQGDYVHCIDCGARGPCGDDPITDWNHRVTDDTR